MTWQLFIYVLFFLITTSQKSIVRVSRLSRHSTADFLYFINTGNPVSCNCGLHLLTNIHEVIVFHRQISQISTLCNSASQTAILHERSADWVSGHSVNNNYWSYYLSATIPLHVILTFCKHKSFWKQSVKRVPITCIPSLHRGIETFNGGRFTRTAKPVWFSRKIINAPLPDVCGLKLQCSPLEQ